MSTAYLVLTIVVSPLLAGGLVYYIQSRIRVSEARETSVIHEQASAMNTPLEVLRGELASKGVALQQTQQQFFEFVDSQMKRNDATTRAMLDVAAECRAQTETLKVVGTSLQAHREESGIRAGKLYEKIADINERVACIESGVKNTTDVATRASETALQAVREMHAKEKRRPS